MGSWVDIPIWFRGIVGDFYGGVLSLVFVMILQYSQCSLLYSNTKLTKDLWNCMKRFWIWTCVVEGWLIWPWYHLWPRIRGIGVSRGTVLQIQQKHSRQSCNTRCPWSVASLSSQLPSCKLVFLEAFLPCTTNGAWHTQSTSRQLHPKNYDGQYTRDPFPKGIVEIAGFILVC